MGSMETFRGVAHPWLCDVMAHLNTRNYVAMFDDAGMHAFAQLGFDWSKVQETKMGWADVKAELELKAEVPLGALVVVRSTVERVGNSSLTIVHRMYDAGGDTLHAEMRVVTVYFDLSARKSNALPAGVRESAQRMISEEG